MAWTYLLDKVSHDPLAIVGFLERDKSLVKDVELISSLIEYSLHCRIFIESEDCASGMQIQAVRR